MRPFLYTPHVKQRSALLLLLLLTATLRLCLLNHPFVRNSEGCAAFYGLLARNYFRYDFSTTHGVPVMSMGRDAPPIFYANHPPTTPLLIAAVYKLLGYAGEYDHLPPDWPIRLPTTLFTLACIVTIYMLVKNRASPRAALLAAALFTTIPLTLAFGGFADVVSPQLLLFAMLTVAAYERFHDHPTWKNFALLGIAFFFAAITDWPAYYLAPVLGIHFLLTRRPKQWPWIVAFGFLCIAIFAVMYSYLAIAQHDWHWMNSLLQHRAGQLTDSRKSFSWNDWLKRAIWQLAIGQHTLVVISLAFLWLPLAIARRFTHGTDRFTALLLAWGILHVIVGRQGVYQHEWWWWPMTPGIVIAAALVIDEFFKPLERKRFAAAALIALFIVFAIVNTRTALAELNESETMAPDAPQLDYTAQEIGQLIRDNASPDQAVMLAESDQSLALWYYADRAIVRFIWDPVKFQTRLNDARVYLPFDIHETWPGRRAAIIIPKAYIPHGLQPLIDYLDANYPRRDTRAFIIYTLSKSSRQ
jgi:4-amino-4-deoxy-L-arabinose transferase-like glycosyltransferase